MKPQTKFRRTVEKLAKQFGITASVSEYMSGVDSRTRQSFATFMLESDQPMPQDNTFLKELEALNQQTFEGSHVLTELKFSVTMAVRYFKLAGQSFIFRDGQLEPVR